MSNLLEKASIVLTPTAYSDGTLHSIKPIQTLGSELVTNGDFATDSDWTLESGWSISNGKLLGTLSNSTNAYQAEVLETGKTYQITYEISNYSQGGVRFQFAGGGGTVSGTSNSSNGLFTEKLKATVNHTSIRFRSLTTSGGFTGSIDNVSVKEVIDADFDFSRGSSATRVNEQGLIEDVQILSGELVQNGDFEQIGSELITNGDFATDSDWIKGTGWTISGGTANQDGSNGILRQNSVISINTKVKVTFDLTNYGGSGSLFVKFAPNQYPITLNGNGSYTVFTDGTNSTNGDFQIITDNGFVGSIDNVSVKEVGQNWTFGTGWSIEDGKAIFNGFSNQSLAQDGIVANNKKYKLTYTISNYVQGGINWRFGTSSNLTTVRSANGTYVEEITSTGSDFRGISSGASELSIDNVSVIEITDDTDLPRIDYTDGTGSLLLEPQSTNTATYSNDFTQGDLFNSSADPGTTSAVLTSQQEAAPDGTNNGWLLKDDNDGGTGPAGLRYFSTQVNSDDFNTISIFAKKALSNDFLILETAGYDADGNGTSYFNISNGSLESTSANHTAKIEGYGDGWYRCSITFQTTTDLQGAIYVRLASSSSSINVTKDGTNGVYIFGLQCEADASQNFPTSYIPTSGSTVTRNADEANNSGSSDLINSTEGVLYAEIAALADDLTFRSIAISDGTLDNRVLIRYRTNSNQINLFIKANSTNIVNSTKTLTDITNFSKFALKYKSGDIALWIDGVEAKTDTNTFTLIGLDRLNFDAGNGSDDFYGKVKSVAVFKEALTDAQLAALTS
jgi:hypothetical protein